MGSVCLLLGKSDDLEVIFMQSLFTNCQAPLYIQNIKTKTNYNQLIHLIKEHVTYPITPSQEQYMKQTNEDTVWLQEFGQG